MAAVVAEANHFAQIQYKVEGRVQGVNFRSFTQKTARSLGVTGFVTNASDGSVCTHNAITMAWRATPHLTRTNPFQVQGEAQATDDKLNDFVHHLHKGPPASSVSKVDHSDIATKPDESGFSVRY